MKNSTIFKMTMTLAIIVSVYVNGLGQTPATVTTTAAGTLDKFVIGTSGEDPDLVTTGTKVPYLVYPDVTLNPLWVEGTNAANTTNLVSTFTWAVPAGVSSTFVPASNTTHYITIDVNGTAAATIHNITVAEKSGSSCPGSTTTLNVSVVDQPTVTALAVSDGTAPVTSICGIGTNGSLGIPVPTFTVTKSTDAAITTPNMKVKATLVFTNFLTGASSNLFVDQILNVSAAGVISNADLIALVPTFQSWGTYTLTINSVSDKISRKDLNTAKGYFTVTGVSAVYTVTKTPSTGPIYHIKNDNTL